MIIILLDNFNNSIKLINIMKSNDYLELLTEIRNIPNLPENYEIFLVDEMNQKIIIDNDEKFNLINDVLFVGPKNRRVLESSLFAINYDLLSESKQEILDLKYNCLLCTLIIKNEKPYFCYKCQKIFHEQCLKNWDQKRKSANLNLDCPNCRNQLPIEQWERKLDYEENRKLDADYMEMKNNLKLNNFMNKGHNLINDNKINSLKDNNSKLHELIDKYKIYIEDTFKIFKDIINKLHIIHSLINFQTNHKLNDLKNNFTLNFEHLETEDISNIIIKELNLFENFIRNGGYKKKLILKPERENEEANIHNKINTIENVLELNPNFPIEKSNILPKIPIQNKCLIIRLIYFSKCEGEYNIFGKKFVNNNRDNLELIINGIQINLVSRYKLRKGNNNIRILIKKKLINLEYMFYQCDTLKNIAELKYLNVKEIKSFSGLFFGCESLSDISSLKNWDVSNCNNFANMFYKCSSLSDISSLKKWVVSKSNNFSSMFYECSSLSDISSLEKWDVLNTKNFSSMFSGCSSLKSISSLENWKVSNSINFSNMFNGCKLLRDIKALQSWDVSKGLNFSSMFNECLILKDLSSIENWIVSNANNFSNMFSLCINLKDLTPLKRWDVSKSNNFSSMFHNCSSLENITPLKYWKAPNCNNFSNMFSGCSSLKDITALKNWDFSNGNNFSSMFSGCSSLKDITPLKYWNVTNGNNFSSIFSGCKSLINIDSLQEWKFKISSNIYYSNMFYQCSSLSDIKPLQDWQVSKGINFSNMFCGCISLIDLKPLQNWDVSNCQNFSNMFKGCLLLTDVRPLKDWDVSNGKYFSHMFFSCSALKDISPLKSWKYSNDIF